MSNTFYVSATVSDDGKFAQCKYFKDQDGKEPIDSSNLHIPTTAGGCVFAPVTTTDPNSLVLIGASFKTLGAAAGMNMSNFAPADDENVVAFVMPTNQTITKGVVLLFSTRGTVENLYPSSDPQVTNDWPSL
jgi:hypothetical protein